jgi:hypothetical protein
MQNCFNLPIPPNSSNKKPRADKPKTNNQNFLICQTIIQKTKVNLLDSFNKTIPRQQINNLNAKHNKKKKKHYSLLNTRP